MSEVEAAQVEAALGCVFPAYFREFIVRYSDELKQTQTALPLRTGLYTDPDEMIRDNVFSRTGDVFRLGEEQRPWPENYLLVASNGGGDYWYVYRDGSDRGVWFWSHESCETERVSLSLDEYLEQLRSDVRKPGPWQFSRG
jgi:hypothetical protein